MLDGLDILLLSRDPAVLAAIQGFEGLASRAFHSVAEVCQNARRSVRLLVVDVDALSGSLEETLESLAGEPGLSGADIVVLGSRCAQVARVCREQMVRAIVDKTDGRWETMLQAACRFLVTGRVPG